MTTIIPIDFLLAGQNFQVQVLRKSVDLGPITVDHCWLDTRRIYGQRQRSTAAHAAVTEYYRHHCLARRAFDDQNTRETYLLACLLPLTRALGSQRVFADARLNRNVLSSLATDLQAVLDSDPAGRMTMQEFSSHTLGVLGPPTYSDSDRELYREMIGDLLEGPASRLNESHDEAVSEVVTCWLEWQRRYGRPRRHDQEKRVLDVVSYECRAAFHRCYSVFWSDVLPRLHRQHGINVQSVFFLYLWHTERVCPPPVSGDEPFRLFHGHILGLHPAAALLLQTESGRDRLESGF